MRKFGFLALLLPLVFGFADDSDNSPSRLAELLGSDAAGFAKATLPRGFSFPADHGPHPEYRNEWWYITGNLDAEGGERFGFELTFFRFSLSPTLENSDSAWRTNQVYIAHLAVTDAQDEAFLVAQRYSRGALGLAGAQAEPFRVWIDDWRMVEQASGEWYLEAQDENFGIELRLNALKPPVFNGNEGLSQKSAEPGNASYYYSITRLGTDGTIRIDGRKYGVSGLSWLDREWSTSALADNQVGWDWFALQLSDGTDLMFYNLRLADGTQDHHSSGTFVSSTGRSSNLSREDVEIMVLDTWDSPEGGTYPSRWRLHAPHFGLDVTVTPIVANQELFTTVRYWEGAVDIAGTRNGESISGRGYVELTGYAK